MIHFYCLAVEASFYSDVVECLPVDPATWVRFPAGAGKIFSLYDNGAHRGTNLSQGMDSFSQGSQRQMLLEIYFTVVNKKGVLKYKTNNKTVQTTQTDK